MPKSASTRLLAALACSTLIPLTLAAPLSAPLEAQMPEPLAYPQYEPTPSITVNGSSEVRTAPDEALVSLGVVAQAEQAREAQREASRIAQGILDGIAALGVPEEAIQTSQLVLTPVYESRATTSASRCRPSRGSSPIRPRTWSPSGSRT